jgi:polyhydroxybutyrate depolymerase
VVSRFKPEHPVSVIALQSVDDPVMPYNSGDVTLPGGRKRAGIVATSDAIRKWVEHNGCRREAIIDALPDAAPNDGCRVETFRHTKGAHGTEVVLYRIDGGGHTWPDGKQYLPRKLIGNVCRDINGTEVIWAFFKAHPKH